MPKYCMRFTVNWLLLHFSCLNMTLGYSWCISFSPDTFSQGEPRVLGLAMIPGHHVVSIEVEADSLDDAQAFAAGHWRMHTHTQLRGQPAVWLTPTEPRGRDWTLRRTDLRTGGFNQSHVKNSFVGVQDLAAPDGWRSDYLQDQLHNRVCMLMSVCYNVKMCVSGSMGS